ncbi:MAG: hypothetical protein Q7S31_01620 [bacterium]|nr:hypothetical protein [bacterium]
MAELEFTLQRDAVIFRKYAQSPNLVHYVGLVEAGTEVEIGTGTDIEMLDVLNGDGPTMFVPWRNPLEQSYYFCLKDLPPIVRLASLTSSPS